MLGVDTNKIPPLSTPVPTKKAGSRRNVLSLLLKLIPATTYSPTNTLRSTIGDERLNCQVRHGTGWDPLSIITGKLYK